MRLIIVFFAIGLSLQSFGQNPLFDPELAKSLGGDDYGMKNYIFVILKTGPAKIADQDALDKMFEGHFENINRMAEMGKLVVAGPYGTNAREYRGMFILDVASPEEASELLHKDPTIANGVFEVEMTPWYGSAALPTYLDNHKKIEKISH